MAYTYVNNKTGQVLVTNRRVRGGFWEEKNPLLESDDEGIFEDENLDEEEIFEEEDPLFDVMPEAEAESEEPVEEAPKKTTRRRGKQE